MNCFFVASGVQFAQSTSGQFHFRRAAFAQQLKSRVVLALAKTAGLRMTLNLDGTSLSFYRLIIVLFLCRVLSSETHGGCLL